MPPPPFGPRFVEVLLMHRPPRRDLLAQVFTDAAQFAVGQFFPLPFGAARLGRPLDGFAADWSQQIDAAAMTHGSIVAR
jgi:hypothetical protein